MPVDTYELSTPDGPMLVHRALPRAEGRFPAVMVLQEAFGVNAHMRRVCERVAALGYAAFAPELFHRAGPGVEFRYDDFATARSVLGVLTNEQILGDVKACHAHMATHPQVDPSRMAAWGFCMGGWAAMLAACEVDLACALSFYGGGVVRPRPGIAFGPILDRLPRARSPLLLVYGAKDPSITAADIDAVREALESTRRPHDIEIYPEGGHGFYCEDRGSYHKPTADLAWARAAAWIADRLRPAP